MDMKQNYIICVLGLCTLLVAKFLNIITKSHIKGSLWQMGLFLPQALGLMILLDLNILRLNDVRI